MSDHEDLIPPRTPGNNQGKKLGKIALPPEFDGNRAKSRHFFQQCRAYMHYYRNTNTYDTDEDKIIFVLGLMNKDEAMEWAVAKHSAAFKTDEVDYGKWKAFTKDFEHSFISTADKAQARTELLYLKQTPGMTIDEFNTKFKTLITRCDFDNPDEHCNTYRAGIRPGILLNIARYGAFPDNLDDWYRVTTAIENAEKEARMVVNFHGTQTKHTNRDRNTNRSTNNPTTITTTNNTSTPKFTNAVPKLTPEERERCRKEGRCFRCREQGHNSSNCPTFKNNQGKFIRAAETTPTSTPAGSTNPSDTAINKEATDPTDVAATIRRLLSSLPEDQREQVYSAMDKEGFY